MKQWQNYKEKRCACVGLLQVCECEHKQNTAECLQVEMLDVKNGINLGKTRTWMLHTNLHLRTSAQFQGSFQFSAMEYSQSLVLLLSYGLKSVFAQHHNVTVKMTFDLLDNKYYHLMI